MIYRKIFWISIFLTLLVNFALAQTTEFSYQGSLKSGGTAANGNYDFEFALFDALAGGNQLGSTVAVNNLAVASGVFSAKLDFGNQFAAGANRFLEIRVRQTGGGALVPLTPRQLIGSVPYSVKSGAAATADVALTANNSLSLGGTAANQFVLTGDSRLSDARIPLAGSASYVQNSTSPQASSNFNISGTGTANIFNAATQLNIGGNRAFTAVGGGSQNVFAGLNAGAANTSGFGNTFAGNFSGNANTTGANNSFYGTDSGRNTNGDGNSFFGRSAGFATTTGINNAFFGLDSGRFNTTGSNNAFYGKESGFNNTADGNSFFGYRAGYGNTSGNSNAFFGQGAGQANQTGNFNSFFGNQAGNLSTGNSNSFFGNSAGVSNNSGGNNAFFGTIAGESNTTGNNNTFYGAAAGFSNVSGGNNTAIGFSANFAFNNMNFATAIGSGSTVNEDNTIALGRGDGSDQVVIYGTLKVLAGIIGNLPSGDADYIQNRSTPQATASFNISGTGTANVFNSATQYNINNARVLGITGTGNLFAGSAAGLVNAGNGNTFVGSGAGQQNTSGGNNTYVGSSAGFNGTTGSFNVAIGSGANVGAGVSNSIAIGANETVNTSDTLTMGATVVNLHGSSIHITGNVDVLTFKVNTLGASGSNQICTNSGGFFSNCSSSLRYKTNVQNFNGGLEMLRQFRPVTFDWKTDGKPDIGFVAEEVEKIEPLLTTRNEKGEIEGVKYAQITTVLVNSVREQQTQIESQAAQIKALQEQIKRQQLLITALKSAFCRQNPAADICK